LVTSQQRRHASALYSPLLNEIEALFARFFGAPHIPPSLRYILLAMFRHLQDRELLAAITASRKRLSPVHLDWLQYFTLHLEIYLEKRGGSVACRRMVLSSIEKIHRANADVTVFHNEIHERLVISLGKTIPEEHDEEILHSVFRILSRELATILSAEQTEEQRNLSLGRICEGWIDLAKGDCRCRPRNQGNPMSGSPSKLTDCSRHTLAVNFLINAFNMTVFTNTGAEPLNPTESTLQRPSVAPKFYLYLFDTLLELIRPQYLRIDKRFILCVKARLAILQWMLRIRANIKNRVFILVGDLAEAISLAQMIQRADGSTTPFWMHNDVEFDLERWKNTGRTSTGSGRSNKHPQSIKSVTDIFTPCTANAPAEGSDGKKAVSKPCWYLPDVLMVDITEEMKRPSRTILTPSNGKDDKCVTLPVHLYLSTITEILTHSDDWEVVSYILCHLPIQLSNKRAFYGPDTNKSMGQLVVALCTATKDNKLYNRMRNITPSGLPPSAVRAILYQNLTVLLGYHNWLERLKLNLNSLIVQCLVEGLAGGIHARKPCLEALSIAVYRVPEEIAKNSTLIVEEIARFATNPFNSLQILEYLLIVGYTPKVHVGIFRDVDYYRVFGLALMFIQDHVHSDVETITTLDGKESYALAQHVYRTSFTVFYVWLLSMKLPERARFAPFIVNGVQDANSKRKKIDPAIETCLDWLLQNTFGNVDPIPWSRFLYTSVAFPGYGSRAIPTDWKRRQEALQENIAESKAWKLGNAIMVVAILKQPVDWACVIVHRPSGTMKLFCRVEKLHRFTPSDGFDRFFDSIGINTEHDIGCEEPQVCIKCHQVYISLTFILRTMRRPCAPCSVLLSLTVQKPGTHLSYEHTQMSISFGRL
jgi:Tuberin